MVASSPDDLAGGCACGAVRYRIKRLPDDVPAFDIYYDMKAFWPAESLKRREAILGPGK